MEVTDGLGMDFIKLDWGLLRTKWRFDDWMDRLDEKLAERASMVSLGWIDGRCALGREWDTR